jgi:hypothetical protein
VKQKFNGQRGHFQPRASDGLMVIFPIEKYLPRGLL